MMEWFSVACWRVVEVVRSGIRTVLSVFGLTVMPEDRPTFDSEVKEEFRGPLSSGEEVTVEVDREVITAAPVIADSPVVIAICPVGELFPAAVHPDQVEDPSEVGPLITEVEAPHLPNLGDEVTPGVLSGTGRPRRTRRPSPIPAGSSRPQRTLRPRPIPSGSSRSQRTLRPRPIPSGSSRSQRTLRPRPIPAGSSRSQRTLRPRPIPAGSSRPQRTLRPRPIPSGSSRPQRNLRPLPIPAGSSRPRRTHKPISVMQVNPSLNTYLFTSPKF
ncbi:keratinocyte proline-rich protein-like [Ruditapes philippinarum]|uniref:keratinocyte proline-rich protein-like n=1 Tax=Ruditapes philippinarum TaxID=129788 RepID=UPI00295B2D4C|nr:keratinocyte proline-rich protein-like [Ruditapes philippinarum]